MSLTPLEIPRLDEASVNLRALGLGLAVVVVTTLFFGLVPALLLLRSQLTADLKSGERGSSRGARRIYSVLVAGEVALACALLVSSALLVRTVGRMTETPTGVDADQVVTTTVQLAGDRRITLVARGCRHARRHHRADSPAARRPRCRRRQLPSARGRLAQRRSASRASRRRRARRTRRRRSITASAKGTSRRWARRWLEGRAFAAFDTPTSAPVVVVNETFARRFLDTGSAVGRIDHDRRHRASARSA